MTGPHSSITDAPPHPATERLIRRAEDGLMSGAPVRVVAARLRLTQEELRDLVPDMMPDDDDVGQNAVNGY